jgi:hypothetical protein
MSRAPSISYSVTNKRTYYYTSNTARTTVNETGTCSVSYAETTASSYASVNTSNGTVTWNANPAVTSDRSVGITATVVNANSTSLKATKAATSICLKDYISSYDSYSDLSGGSFSYSNASINGGTITPTHTKAT